MKKNLISGILTREGSLSFVAGIDGKRYFERHPIWEGYLTHWEGERVCCRLLHQKDYETDSPIIIMWSESPPPSTPFVELYYNERLVKYWASTFGHNAVNLNGEIFNFSHLLNENEIMTEEEYFFRPALGEFAPSPETGRFAVADNGRVYYDKFGRNFMRTIHVLHIEGIDIDRMAAFYKGELQRIHDTPVNPKKPEKYRDFNFLTRSCSTIIRDGFVEYGYTAVDGIFPRDLFVSAAFALQKEKHLKVSVFKKPQLMVPEAPPSALSPLMNIKNSYKVRKLKYLN